MACTRKMYFVLKKHVIDDTPSLGNLFNNVIMSNDQVV